MAHPERQQRQSFHSVALPDICRVEDLAEHLHLTPETVRKALRAGRIPGQRLGRTWLIPRLALLAWLAGSPLGASTPTSKRSSLRVIHGERGDRP
jgi:excisionase family DNA binding protein